MGAYRVAQRGGCDADSQRAGDQHHVGKQTTPAGVISAALAAGNRYPETGKADAAGGDMHGNEKFKQLMTRHRDSYIRYWLPALPPVLLCPTVKPIIRQNPTLCGRSRP